MLRFSTGRMKKQRDKVPSKLPAFLNALLFWYHSSPMDDECCCVFFIRDASRVR